MKKIIFFLFLIFLINLVSAAHSTEYLTELANQIGSDCDGQIIEYQINIYVGHGTPLDNKNGTINSSEILSFLKSIDNSSFYHYSDPSRCNYPFSGFRTSGDINGCKILICGNNRLDRLESDFYWNLVEYEGSKQVTNVAQVINSPNSQATAGNNNIQTNSNNNISISLPIELVIGGSIIGLGGLTIYLIKRKKRRKIKNETYKRRI